MVVPVDLGAHALDAEGAEVLGELAEERARDAPALEARVHEECVDHRDGLGNTELAVLERGEQGADDDAVGLDGERDTEVGVAQRPGDLALEELLAGAAHDRAVDADDSVQVGLAQVANDEIWRHGATSRAAGRGVIGRPTYGGVIRRRADRTAASRTTRQDRDMERGVLPSCPRCRPVNWLVRSAMRDMMPSTGDLPGILDTDVDGFLARLRRETTGMVWTGLVLGALLFVVSPVVTIYVPLPTLLLPASLRDKHADRITTTRFYLLRQSVFLLKMYACMCWGQDEAVRRRFHLPAYPVDTGGYRTS